MFATAPSPGSSGSANMLPPAKAAGASHLFQILRDAHPRSRSELAALTGLSRSTVTERLNELVATDLIGPAGEGTSTGGRPPSTLALRPEAKIVLVAAFGASALTVGALDLTNRPLRTISVPLDIAEGPEACLTRAHELFRTLLGDLARRSGDVLAIGVGLPGPVHFDTGTPSRPPLMRGWDAFDVPGWFKSRYDAPTLVDNDVNILALGEFSRRESERAYMLVVKVSTGIGAGVISSGHIQRGAQGISGDIGHVRVASGTGILCQCGNEGCLEAVASGAAIARRLRAKGVDTAHTSSDVVRLVNEGNVEAINVVRQAGRDLGEVLSAGVSLLNPEVICVAGSMAEVGEHLLAGVREVVYQRTMPLAAQKLHIYTISDADHAGVLGAGILALEHALSPRAISALLASKKAP